MTTTVSIKKQTIRGIPTLTFAPAKASGCPLVFFIHGFTGSKEEGIPLGYRLAQAGMFAVSMDAHLHGERLGEPLDDLGSSQRSYIYPPGTGFDTYFIMLECALQTAQDFAILIEHFAGDRQVNPQKVGVTGFSMGGFATYFAAAHIPQICAAAPAGAYPDLPRRWHDLMLEAAAYPEWTEVMDSLPEENERRSAWLREIDPAARLLHGERKPLLMLIGDQDTDSPKAYTVPFFGAMRPLYRQQPEQLRLKIVDGVAHQFTGGMMDDITTWFSAWLLEK
jgi:uncharacterized protein